MSTKILKSGDRGFEEIVEGMRQTYGPLSAQLSKSRDTMATVLSKVPQPADEIALPEKKTRQAIR